LTEFLGITIWPNETSTRCYFNHLGLFKRRKWPFAVEDESKVALRGRPHVTVPPTAIAKNKFVISLSKHDRKTLTGLPTRLPVGVKA